MDTDAQNMCACHMESERITLPNKHRYMTIDALIQSDLPYIQRIKIWNSYKELTELLCKLLMEIETALYGILTFSLYIRQILNNDANNIVLLFGTDINECLLDACGSNSICNNTRGSFRCKCKPGFQSTSGDGKDCSGETVEMRGAVFSESLLSMKMEAKILLLPVICRTLVAINCRYLLHLLLNRHQRMQRYQSL